MLISLRKYLDSRPEQLKDALLRTIRLLLEAIDVHAIRGDITGYEKFRQDIASVRERFAVMPPASEVLVLAARPRNLSRSTTPEPESSSPSSAPNCKPWWPC